MRKNRAQELRDELKSINIYYINGDFIYSKNAQNLPSSYEEYKKNKKAYPEVDNYLSLELSSMVSRPEQLEQDGYQNNLAQKPAKLDIPETIILQSGELTIKDEDVPDNLKKAGYVFERGNIILKVVKNDNPKDNKKYNLVNYDGSRLVGIMFGGHNSALRKLVMNDITICMDKDLAQEIKKLNKEEKTTELREIYNLAKGSTANISSLERMGIFVHEMTHANNSMSKIIQNNEQIKTNGKKAKSSLEEEGFKERNDEVSAVFHALRFEINHYNENNKPEDTKQYSTYFRSFLKKCNEQPAEQREKHLNSPKEQLAYIDEAWSIKQGALYTTMLNSQVLKKIEHHSKYTCAFDIQSDKEAYKKTLQNYFNVKDSNINIQESMQDSPDIRMEYGYIMGMSIMQQQTVDNRIKALNSVGIDETVREKMIELDKLETKNNNFIKKENTSSRDRSFNR